MSLDGVREAYFHGVPDVSRIEPEAYWLDAALLAQPGMMDLQVDLKLDYKANLERYPLYQQYLRTHQPPLLAIWGKNDSFFVPLGAEAFKRDVPNAAVTFLDTGHFALETNVEDIASAILKMPMRGCRLTRTKVGSRPLIVPGARRRFSMWIRYRVTTTL